LKQVMKRPHFQISGIIPTYNREKTIARAIDSALNQEYPLSEIIIIDDGSRDGTHAIVESYGEKVKYIYQENLGVSAARNRGVREAKYEWIAFLDSDDYWLQHHIRCLAEAIEATRGEAALYFGDTHCRSSRGENSYWNSCGFGIAEAFEFRRDASSWVFKKIQPMLIQASVIRRKVYLEIGGLPEAMRTREDTLLFFLLGILYPVCAVASCGTVLASDATNRLTHEYNSQSLTYQQATNILYKKVLSHASKLSRKQRRFLVDSLSKSYLAAGLICLRQRKYPSSIKNLLISCFISPSFFMKQISRSMLKCSMITSIV